MKIDNINWDNIMSPINNITFDTKLFETPECYCKKEGEDNMFNNEVLNLYYNKQRKKINKEYEEIINKKYNENPAVKEYNEVVSEFETTLAELADKYNKEDNKILVKTGYTNDYEYEINSKIKEIICIEESKEKEEAYVKLKEYCDEVGAQLTLSNDLEYQLDVLKKYEILDKNGKLNV